MTRRLGIGRRLFVAFVAIAVLSLLPGLLGWFILRDVAEEQATVTGRAMPAAAGAQSLAELSTRLVASAPALSGARNEAERARQAALLQERATALTGALASFDRSLFTAEDLAALNETVAAMLANLERLGALVATRLASEARLQQQIADALSAAGAITDLSETLVSNAASTVAAVMANLYGLIEAEGDSEPVYLALDRLVESDLYLLERMFELRLRSSQMGLLLNQLAKATAVSEIARIEEAYNGHLRVLVRRVATIADPIRQQQAEQQLAVLRRAAGPPAEQNGAEQNVFSLQRELLSFVARSRDLEDSNRALAEALSRRVEALVAEAKAFSDSAAAGARSAVDAGLAWLIGAFLAALALASLVVWLYVERRIARRLNQLSRAMRGLATGALEVEVSAEGRDELAEMGRAIHFFRDEAERKRELEAERERVNAELRRHREELQVLVDERTRQLQDANERLQDEVALHDEARQKAEAASRAKSEFLATMSHEIRTPMSGMLGMLRVLQEGPLSGEQQRHLRLLGTAGEALLGILNSILDYSKIESGHLEVESVAFEPRGLVEGMASLLRPSAEEKGLTLAVEIGASVPAALAGDAGKLRQILFNLLGNAIKFTERGGVQLTLGVAGSEEGDCRLAFTVADSGIGIPPEQQARVFEAFTQLDPSIARRYGGTGLGLAICKRLADLLGGSLALDSAPGQGSRFTLTAPFAPALAEAVTPQAEPCDAEVAGMPCLDVLLVEDNEVNQVVAETFLTQLGHRVTLVADGQSAVEAVAQGRYDLVIMDISLPGMDGLEATRRIRALPDPALSGLPIIAMSAHVFRDEINRHLAAGMNAFVGKPLLPELLAAAIRQVMGRQEQRSFLPEHHDGAVLLADEVLARDLAALGPERTGRIIDLFLETVPARLASLTSAIRSDDLAEVRQRAHSIRSATSSLGLERLTRAMEEIEQAATDGDGDAVRRAAKHLSQLYERSAAALAARRRSLAQAAAE